MFDNFINNNTDVIGGKAGDYHKNNCSLTDNLILACGRYLNHES